MATKITDHYIKIGIHKYFRGNAHLLDICSYGEKKDPIGPKSYIDKQNDVKREHLVDRIETAPPVTVDWSSSTKASVEINGLLKFFGINGKVDANGTYEKAKNGHLQLINFSIPEGKLRGMLNKDASGALKYLADEGKDGRIVSEIWVVMEAELAEHFGNYGKATLGAKVLGSSLELTVSGGKYGSQSITIGAGTTFAYKSHKVKKWEDKKTRIANMEADYFGLS